MAYRSASPVTALRSPEASRIHPIGLSDRLVAIRRPTVPSATARTEAKPVGPNDSAGAGVPHVIACRMTATTTTAIVSVQMPQAMPFAVRAFKFRLLSECPPS
jgi:hypothetical protein